MPKLLLNKAQDTFLQETTCKTSDFNINTIVRQALEKMLEQDADNKELKIVCLVIFTLLDKNKKKQSYMYHNQDVTHLKNVYYSSHEKQTAFNFINVVQPKSTKEVNLGTPTGSAKNYYDIIHNNLPEVLNAFNTIISTINSSKTYVFNHRGDTYAGHALVSCLKGVAQALSQVNAPPIDFKLYTLKEFKGGNMMDNKKLYYVVCEERFFTLIKGRKASPTFIWGLTSNMDAAFLFNGDLKAYGLPYEEDTLNKIFVDVKVQSVEKKSASKVTDELFIRIENREINNLLTENEPVEEAPIMRKKVSKL